VHSGCIEVVEHAEEDRRLVETAANRAPRFQRETVSRVLRDIVSMS